MIDDGTTATPAGAERASACQRARELEALFLAHLETIEAVVARIGARYGLTADETEEFAAAVKLKMVEDGYAVLAKHEGRSPMRHYLAVVLQRLYLDYRNHQWGRWRPCAEAQRMGPVAIELDRLLTRDGLTLREAAPMLRGRFGDLAEPGQLEDMALRLPQRFTRRQREQHAVPGDTPAPSDPEADLLAAEAEARRRLLIERARAAIGRLDDEDRLILTLRLESGAAIADIARLLGLPARPMYRRIEALLARVRRCVEVEAGAEAATAGEARRATTRVDRAPWGGDSTRKGAESGPSSRTWGPDSASDSATSPGRRRPGRQEGGSP